MISKPGTLGQSIEIVSTILSEAGIENSRREAHLLLQYVTGKSVTDLRGSRRQHCIPMSGTKYCFLQNAEPNTNQWRTL